MKKIKFHKILLYFLINLLVIGYGGWIYSKLPDEFVAFEGEDYFQNAQIQAGNYFSINKISQAQSEDKEAIQLSSNTSIRATAKLLGIIPFKDVTIDVLPTQNVVPCGSVVGVKLFTNGLLVLDVAKFNTNNGSSSPAKNAGLKAGDVILKANNQKLTSIEQMSEIVYNNGAKPIELVVLRDNKEFNVNITPSLKGDDGTYKIGAWVRDSTAGIGTLTFYRPENNSFAALGHGIMDNDLGKVYSISSGSIQAASIIAVNKGERGAPGELRGMFVEDTMGMGTITSNTQDGIYGKINIPKYLPHSNNMQAISRTHVTEGSASILCTISGEKVEEFSAKILKVLPSSGNSSKSMIIEIVDKRLLEKTGGIVQGMSGSPIIQNGKLVGAVTHVFINDPTRGYGIFIDTMLKH